MTVFAAWVDYVDTLTLLIFLVVFLCGLWLLSTAGGPANWPPGPKSWPVIGNADVFWNNQQLYLTFTELAKTYGEMFHLRIGRSTHIVVLTGNDVIREAFVDKAEYFSNRPNFFPIVRYMCNGKGSRKCLGDSLAKMEMFLFMTTLLQRFDFRMVDADNPPSTNGIQRITRYPHKYELIASRM